MPEQRSGLLIIMAKQPQPGAVKTRLSPALSSECAFALYTAFLRDTIMLVEQACRMAGNVTPALAYAPREAHDYFRSRVPAHFVLLPQQGESFGERLGNLPAQARARGYGTVAMIDSDSPTLPPAYVAQCFAELVRPAVDVALGPCRDGGYYLIGMRQPQPALFQNISWSTARVTLETLTAAQRAALRVAVLPSWYDIDTADDLEPLRATLAGDAMVAPYTRAVLDQLGLLPRDPLLSITS